LIIILKVASYESIRIEQKIDLATKRIDNISFIRQMIPELCFQHIPIGSITHHLDQYETYVTRWPIEINSALQTNFSFLILIGDSSELPNHFIEILAYFIINGPKVFLSSGGEPSKQ
jgi:hypothetical protein